MTFTGTLAGLGIAVATLLATVWNQAVSSPAFIACAVIGLLSAGAFTLAGLSAVPSWVRPILEAHRPPPGLPQVIDNRWLYSTDQARSQAVRNAMEIALPGTGTKLKEDQPPWVRFVATVACSPITVEADPDLHYMCFEDLLDGPIVRSLIDSLTSYSGEVTWWRWSASRPGLHEAVLGTTREEEQPVASARLELPVPGAALYGRDSRVAMMMLHIEPRKKDGSPADPKTLEFWTVRVEQALWLPRHLAELLDVLELRPSGDPPAQVGVRLEGTRDIAELVDIRGRHPMRGSVRGSQEISFFIADAEGKSAEQAAAIMIRDMELYTLKTSAV